MSLLDGTSNDAASDDSAAREALAGAADDKDPPEQELPAPETTKPVTLEKPKSRRERAEDVVNGKLKELSETVGKLSEGISARDRQIGELTGHLQALAQRPAYQPPQQYAPPPPQLPDPEELERKAQEAIDRKDFSSYQRLTREASVAATLRALQPGLSQLAQRAQAPAQHEGVHPGLMPYFAAYPEVATHPEHQALLAAKNIQLGARGVPIGPGRLKMIFDEVQADLRGTRQPGAPAYSQSSAAVLSGTPTSRPAGGSSAHEGKPRVELTQEERYFAKKAGFSEHDIATEIAKSHPERILR